jgi:ubiquinone/menaquinone biosynthesis C-methylase UbiE
MSMTKSSALPPDSVAKTQASYDAVAAEYARNISHELDHRPGERDLLRRFAERCRNRGVICDLGCGPGHIAHYLHPFNPEVIGLDLSLGLLQQAQSRNRDHPLVFLQGDMLALPFPSDALGGIVAFYSLIHFNDAQLDRSLAEMRRVLSSQGQLLLGFHVGTHSVHVDELWGIAVDLDARFYPMSDLKGRLNKISFSVVDEFQRDPYPEIEYQSVRGYIWAEKSG